MMSSNPHRGSRGRELARIWLYILALGPPLAVLAIINFRQTRKQATVVTWDSMKLRSRYADAVQYWLRRFDERGLFSYAVTHGSDGPRSSVGDNIIRQAMSTRLLAEIAVECVELREMHRRNLDALLDEWYAEEPNGRGFLVRNGQAKAGASGIVLAAIGVSPYGNEYVHESLALVEGLRHAWNGGRDLDPWLIRAGAPDRDYAERLLTFYSGEVVLGLQHAADRFDDKSVSEFAYRLEEAFGVFYADSIEDSFYPAYVPWHTMAMKRYAGSAPGSSTWRARIFTMNDRLLAIQDTLIWIGRFFNPDMPYYGRPHASSDAIYVEGLSHAYEVARLADDSIAANQYLRAVARGLEYIWRRQITGVDVDAAGIDDSAIGGIPNIEGSFSVRIDNVQHAIDAMRNVLRLEASGLITRLDLRDAGIGNVRTYASSPGAKRGLPACPTGTF